MFQAFPYTAVDRPARGAASTEHSGLQGLSEFEYQRPAQVGDVHAGRTRLASLNPSLLQDLQRADACSRPGGAAGVHANAGAGPGPGPGPGPDPDTDTDTGTGAGAGAGLDLLEVLAAALRHGQALQLHLELDNRVIPVAVWPAARVVHSPMSLDGLLALRLPELRVLLVQPAGAEPPARPGDTLPNHRSPLGTLLWELALRGARGTLLAQIAGSAAYRVSPGAELGAELGDLGLVGTLAAAVERLRRDSRPLRDIAAWPGFDPDRACRLLNGLYLQAALIVSHNHPQALG